MLRIDAYPILVFCKILEWFRIYVWQIKLTTGGLKGS